MTEKTNSFINEVKITVTSFWGVTNYTLDNLSSVHMFTFIYYFSWGKTCRINEYLEGKACFSLSRDHVQNWFVALIKASLQRDRQG